MSFKRKTNDSIEFSAIKYNVGVVLANGTYLPFEQDINVSGVIHQDGSCTPVWVLQSFNPCVNFERRAYYKDNNNCGFPGPNPVVESCKVVTQATASVNFLESVSTVVKGGVSLGGEVKQMNQFTSGNLVNVDLSAGKRIGKKEVLIEKIVQMSNAL